MEYPVAPFNTLSSGSTDISNACVEVLSHCLAFGLKYGTLIADITYLPVLRGINMYSLVMVPVIWSRKGVFSVFVVGGNTSIFCGNCTSGKLKTSILPVPLNSILRVAALFALTLIGFIELDILKSPTAPVNPSGISPGNSLTLIAVFFVRKTFGTVWFPKEPKNGSLKKLLLLLRLTVTLQFIVIGVNSSLPDLVGKMAIRYSVAIL